MFKATSYKLAPVSVRGCACAAIKGHGLMVIIIIMFCDCNHEISQLLC